MATQAYTQAYTMGNNQGSDSDFRNPRHLSKAPVFGFEDYNSPSTCAKNSTEKDVKNHNFLKKACALPVVGAVMAAVSVIFITFVFLISGPIAIAHKVKKKSLDNLNNTLGFLARLFVRSVLMSVPGLILPIDYAVEHYRMSHPKY